MPTIAVLADDRNGYNPDPAIRAVEAAGGQVRIVAPAGVRPGVSDAGGLLLADPHPSPDDSPAAVRLLAQALSVDMPVLATGGGMHLLNAGFGGQPAQPVSNHGCPSSHEPRRHQIYLSPGSKVAAIIGSAGMFRVNSRHRLGLRESRRALRLMSVAYRLDDGIIEGLESKEHSWVIGVQFLPERSDEVPAGFNNLFLGLVERAANFAGASR